MFLYAVDCFSVDRHRTVNHPIQLSRSQQNIWRLNDMRELEDSAQRQKNKPSINWTYFPVIRFWDSEKLWFASCCLLAWVCPALQAKLFRWNASAPTMFGVCTFSCSKRHDSCYNLKKPYKHQGNIYKMWLFIMEEFTFTSLFMKKCLSCHKREVLGGCTMNSQLFTSSLSRLWINCAAKALTLSWHCARGSICTHVLKHSVPGSSPKL